MIFGAKIVIFLETKEYFTHNLVIWRIFIWSFGHQLPVLVALIIA